MVFSSSIFLFIFLPAVLLIYYNPFIKTRGFRNVFLFLASLAFYAWGEPIFVFLMIISIIISWILGLEIQKNGKNKKTLLTIGTIYHVFVMFIFKYLTFTAKEVGLLLHTDLSFINIALPIGISFFTFQLMSYLFDIYYGKATAQKNILYVGLYVSLFPQLIAGPIVRYETVADEIQNRVESFDEFILGMERFVYGMAKKVLIANYVAQIADNCFDYLTGMSVATAWLGAITYTLQIYFDFSGYADMAIGMGRMFGFHFPEDFNYPYISRSISEFWHRWHISLTTWFRDYVYFPLGGNRCSKGRWLVNIIIVWLLTGIWHGANWNFIMWGLFYCAVQLLEKFTGFHKKLGIFRRPYTLIVIVLARVLFRADGIGAAVKYLGNMFGAGASCFADSAFTGYLSNTWFVIILAVIGSTPLVKVIFEKLKARNLGWIEQVWLVVVFALSCLQIVSGSYNPFIYFNF